MSAPQCEIKFKNAMKNILEEIRQHKVIEVRNRKKEISLQEICKKIKCSDAPKDFAKALMDKAKDVGMALICEVKKASPSHGLIRADFDHIQVARDYENAGAACLSVLTDEKYFMGSNQYLQEIRAVSNLPILRKDFMVDPYQIYEAKMLGADCILLIVAMLDDEKLVELEQCAFDLGLSVLIEVHNEEELQRVSKLKSKLIGINNRNLKTLKVNLQTSIELSKQVPQGYILVGESGIKSRSDIETLQKCGINHFLIGEHFMRQEDIVSAVRNLF